MIFVFAALLSIACVYAIAYLWRELRRADASVAPAGQKGDGDVGLNVKRLILSALPVALVASCSGSLVVGTAEAWLGRDAPGSLIVDSPSAVFGLAFAATSVALPVTLLALWLLIVPLTIVLDRAVSNTGVRDVGLIGLGVSLGLLIVRLLGLDLGLNTDIVLGAIYGLAASVFWVLALHRLQSPAQSAGTVTG